MKKLKLSIKNNFYILFLCLFLLPMLLCSAFFSWYYAREIQHQNDSTISTILTTVSKNLELCFQEMESVSFTPYLYQDVLDNMRFIKKGYFEEKPDYIDTAYADSAYTSIFTKLMYTSSENISSIIFYPSGDADDTCYMLYRSDAGIHAVPSDGYFQEGWYQNALELEGSLTFSPVYKKEGSLPSSYVLTRAIYDLDSHKLLGILRIEASASSLSSSLKDLDINGHSAVLLLSDSGEAVCSAGVLDEAIISQLEAGYQNEEAFTSFRHYVISRNTLPTSGWTLLYLDNYEDLLRTQAITCGAVLLATLMIALLTFLIYRYRTGQMVSSVNDILTTLKYIQNGNLSVRSKVEGENELALISRAVNQMEDQLKIHIEKEKQSAISQKNAEYRALQAQINPHFLYNTLNVFIALNRMGEKKMLEDAILQLTGLFRYTCSNADTAQICKELEFCEQYLKLQKLHYDERLDYEIHADPAALHLEVPKLLLQPLVENSVKHGMADQELPLLITIRVTYDGASLLIEEKDNGMGFEQKEGNISETSVGLKNIEERLQLFAPGAYFKISSACGHGTGAVICIPADTAACNGTFNASSGQDLNQGGNVYDTADRR